MTEMSVPSFRDSALVLIAHGSTLNAESARAATFQAEALRREGTFAEVHEAYVLLEPSVWGALRRVVARRIFVVPLFVSEGWFTHEVIPTQLGLRSPGQVGFKRVQQDSAGRWVHYCGAVGTHPSMTDVLVARARGVVERHPFPRAPKFSECALFVAGHGTGYHRGSREAIEAQVRRLRERSWFEEVHAVFMEEDPGIGQCWELTRARNLIVVPFFVSDGLHTREDIPRLLGMPANQVAERVAAGMPAWRNPGERAGRKLWYADPVGMEPGLRAVILRQVREMDTERETERETDRGLGRPG